MNENDNGLEIVRGLAVVLEPSLILSLKDFFCSFAPNQVMKSTCSALHSVAARVERLER